jgi:hypothetical protein
MKAHPLATLPVGVIGEYVKIMPDFIVDHLSVSTCQLNGKIISSLAIVGPVTRMTAK